MGAMIIGITDKCSGTCKLPNCNQQIFAFLTPNHFCSGNVTCNAVFAVAKMERHWLVNPFFEYLISTNIRYLLPE